MQPNVLKDWVTGCVNGPLSTQERCLCEFTTKASNSKDSIFKSICTDLECFLLKQVAAHSFTVRAVEFKCDLLMGRDVNFCIQLRQ